ncbi:MAG: hypothetical protein LBI42_03945, partial [Chitinispirillales bacterium]|nr:hypothetical protein [Chitinispirillales bacterium]
MYPAAPIADGSIRASTGSTAHYIGNNAAKFSGFSETNLRKLDSLPPLLKFSGLFVDDIPFNVYTYDADAVPYKGIVELQFGFVPWLAVSKVEISPDVNPHYYFSDNSNKLSIITFHGTYNEPEITLTVTGTLTNGRIPVDTRIPVSFTYAPFGINIDNSNALALDGSPWALMSVELIKEAIETRLSYGDEVVVTGKFEGEDKTIKLNIPDGKKIVWEAEYSGNIDGGELFDLEGGGTFEMRGGKIANTGNNGPVISSSGVDVDISGGLVYSSSSNPIHISVGKRLITGEAVVFGWDKDKDKGRTSYCADDSHDINVYYDNGDKPAVIWTIDGGKSGISYINGGNAGFVEFAGVTVNAEHQWGDWIVKIPATCEIAGVEERICKNNPAHNEPRPIPSGHDWHDFPEWDDSHITKAPTCAEAGSRTRVRACKRDHTHIHPDPETEEIPVLTGDICKTVSIVERNREIPELPDTDKLAAAPSGRLSAEFTVGPNPVSKNSGVVKLFRQG